MRQRRVSPSEYRHVRYGLYGAFSVASALLVTGLVVLLNIVGLILAIIARH